MSRLSKAVLEVLVVVSAVIQSHVVAIVVLHFLVIRPQTSFTLLQCSLHITEKVTEHVWSAMIFYATSIHNDL